MNKLKSVVEQLFGSPVQNMSYVHYFQYVNESGKITAKSLMDLVVICLTYIDEQEKKNEQYEDNFDEIKEILTRLAESKKITQEVPQMQIESTNMTGAISTMIGATGSNLVEDTLQFPCPECEFIAKSQSDLQSHARTHKKVV